MNPLNEQRLGTALRDLVAQQPFIPDASAIEQRAHRARRRDRVMRGGIGAGAVAIAAAVAVGIAGVGPSTPAGTAQASGTHPAGKGTPSTPAGAWPQLMTLAADVAAEPKPAGDATLMERETGAPGKASINVWDLYADNGQYFFSQTKAGLPAQVKEGNTQGGGWNTREIAAAIFAVHGNLETAALKMAWSPDTTPVPAWLKAQAKTMQPGTQIDNYVWENSEDALVVGSGNPQVRAGVLRLVSLLPDITVTRGTLDGQPTITITAGSAEVGNVIGKPDKAYPKGKPGAPYSEAITINANTGVPLQGASSVSGKVYATVSYVVTRVNLADVAAGKF